MARAAIVEDGVVVNVAVASEEYAAYKGWIISETAQTGDFYDPETGIFTTPEPEFIPPPPGFTYKTAIWERFTKEEAEIFMAQKEQAEAKFRGMWDDSITIEHDSPFFETLKAEMVNNFGQERADQILEISGRQ